MLLLRFLKYLPANMHHSVFKEHQIHGRYEVVVAGHGLRQQLAQLLPRGDWHVLGLANSASEVAVDVRTLEHYSFIDVLRKVRACNLHLESVGVCKLSIL